MTDGRNTFELRRRSDDLVYTFDRVIGKNGAPAYKRRDGFLDHEAGPLWDEAGGSCLGRPWDVLPRDQGDHPPEGEWVSRKGARSYVYHLVSAG